MDVEKKTCSCQAPEAKDGEPNLFEIMSKRMTEDRIISKHAKRYLHNPDGELIANPIATDAEGKRIDDTGFLRGYAARFNNIDLGREVIRPGAFKKTMEAIDAGHVPLMVKHFANGGDAMEVIGSIRSGVEDQKGLFVNAEFADTRLAQDARKLVTGGHVKGLSIGYIPIETNFIGQGKDKILELKELKLLEITLTPFPMNLLARVTDAKGLRQVALEVTAYAKSLSVKLDAEALDIAEGRLVPDTVGCLDCFGAMLDACAKVQDRLQDILSNNTPEVTPEPEKKSGGADLSKMDARAKAARARIERIKTLRRLSHAGVETG